MRHKLPFLAIENVCFKSWSSECLSGSCINWEPIQSHFLGRLYYILSVYAAQLPVTDGRLP